MERARGVRPRRRLRPRRARAAARRTRCSRSWSSSPRPRTSGCTSSSPGAAAAPPGRCTTRVLGRLRELAAPGLVMNGSPDEGALVGNVKPASEPPGRGVLVDRRRDSRRVQLAWLPPTPSRVSGTPVRVAVQAGRGHGAGRRGGARTASRGWSPSCRRRCPGSRRCSRSWSGRTPEELVLVHPGPWPADRVARWAQEYAGLAARVRAVPAPLAAAGRGGVAVLDVGSAGAEAALLDADGRVRAWRTRGGRAAGCWTSWWQRRSAGTGPPHVRCGRRCRCCRPWTGSRPRTVLPVARRAAGAAVAGAVRRAGGRRGDRAVLLVGGVARSPLLARLVDEAGIAGAVVAPRPEAAAVLGALTLPPDAGSSPPRRNAPRSGRCRLRGWLPALPARRRRPVRAALLGTAPQRSPWSRCSRSGRLRRRPPPMWSRRACSCSTATGSTCPAGWEHTGGLPERRRVLLTPLAAPDGSDLIAVERSPLGYDTAAEPERAQRRAACGLRRRRRGRLRAVRVRPGRAVRRARGHRVPAGGARPHRRRLVRRPRRRRAAVRRLPAHGGGRGGGAGGVRAWSSRRSVSD